MRLCTSIRITHRRRKRKYFSLNHLSLSIYPFIIHPLPHIYLHLSSTCLPNFYQSIYLSSVFKSSPYSINQSSVNHLPTCHQFLSIIYLSEEIYHRSWLTGLWSKEILQYANCKLRNEKIWCNSVQVLKLKDWEFLSLSTSWSLTLEKECLSPKAGEDARLSSSWERELTLYPFEPSKHLMTSPCPLILTGLLFYSVYPS